ncbi:1-phosphofructokinase family hexose kinase [Corynebacterium sp. CCM 9204]|uniref:1-phosphofructokinase family hexose kinase n=1 Tax=Corynebacterium sp. CCM 9204 TaxID=3057616 RepID=UPI003524F7A0
MSTQSPAGGAAVIAITPNPALDVTITLDRLVPEKTHRIDSAQRKLGGKGVNVAAVAAAEGYPAVMLGPVNDDAPTYTAPDGKAAPESAFTPTPVRLRETFAIHTISDGATSIINERGDRHPDEIWTRLVDQLGQVLVDHPGSVVTVSGSWPPGADENVLNDLITRTREAGGRIIVDCAGSHLRTACRAGVDVVKPNAAELAETTGTDDLEVGAAQLLDLGVGLVIVSMGEDGLLAVDHDGSTRTRLPQPLTGNPTGAGDALVSALATGLIDELERSELLRRATAWSAAAVLEDTAGVISDRWQELANDVIIDERTN